MIRILETCKEDIQREKQNLQRLTLIQYKTVKPKLKGPSLLLRFRDSFGLKRAKI